MRKEFFSLMEGEPGTTGGGVDVAQAREFLTGFSPDPEIVKTLPDDQVLAWHGNVNKQLATAQQKALESYDWKGPILKAKPDAAKTLERFPGPVELYDSFDQFRTKLSKGELRTVQAFPEKGSDDEKATWRQQNGIPPDGKYEVKLAEGLVMGEQDKPVVDSFTKYAYEQNMPASELNKAVNWYFAEKVQREQRAHEQFETQKRETAATLGAEWGVEYKPTLNKIDGMLDSTIPAGEEGEALKGLIKNALSTNALFARHYAQLALQLNPMGTLVPGGGWCPGRLPERRDQEDREGHADQPFGVRQGRDHAIEVRSSVGPVPEADRQGVGTLNVRHCERIWVYQTLGWARSVNRFRRPEHKNDQ